MHNSFKVTIPSNSPEIIVCEVFLSGGSTAFETGWMVTKFVPGILKANKVVSSVAFNPPNIQVSATLDSKKEKPRIAVLLGRVDPNDRKIVEVSSKNEVGDELTVYWTDWKIGDVEWSGKELEVVQGA